MSVDRWLGRRRPLALPVADPARPARPCIVHLVRAANGQAPYRAFVDALHRCPPGIDCDLVLAMKGFDGPRDAQPYLELVQDYSPEPLFFSDDGLDLTAYLAAAATLRRDRYCFLNSYSQPLVEGWLAKLDAALMKPGTGMAGATGSCGSSRSWTTYLLHLPSAYSRVLPEHRLAREQVLAIGPEPGGSGRRSALRWLRAKLRNLRDIPQQILPFDPFPNFHMRTNAFMISHNSLAALRLHAVDDKKDAYLLESGRQSITRQIQAMNLRALIVDRGGVAYDRDLWGASRTFWQGDQEGLLVADNQTRHYTDGDINRRRVLSAFAWGAQAEPSSASRIVGPPRNQRRGP